MEAGLRGLARLVSELARDNADVTALLRPILRPENDGKQKRADAHRHVGEVERGPPRVTHTDVEEIHDAEVRRLDAIEQITERAAADQRERDHARAVALARRD